MSDSKMSKREARLAFLRAVQALVPIEELIEDAVNHDKLDDSDLTAKMAALDVAYFLLRALMNGSPTALEARILRQMQGLLRTSGWTPENGARLREEGCALSCDPVDSGEQARCRRARCRVDAR